MVGLFNTEQTSETTMSFLKSLFGGGKSETAKESEAREDYKGFSIIAQPGENGGQYRIGGTIEKVEDGETKRHTFIRADYFASRDEAVEATFRKAKSAIDQLGDSLFA